MAFVLNLETMEKILIHTERLRELPGLCRVFHGTHKLDRGGEECGDCVFGKLVDIL
jgi:hypothetical protein